MTLRFAALLVAGGTLVPFAACKKRDFNAGQVRSNSGESADARCVEPMFVAFNEPNEKIAVYADPNGKALFELEAFETMRCVGKEGSFYKMEFAYQALRKLRAATADSKAKTALVKASTVLPSCGIVFIGKETAIFDNAARTADPLKVSLDTPLLCVRGFDVDNDGQRDDSLQVRYGKDFKEVGYVSPQDIRPSCGTYKVAKSAIASAPKTALLESLGGKVKAMLPGGTTLSCSRDLGIWKFVSYLTPNGVESGYIDGHDLEKLAFGSEEERVALEKRNNPQPFLEPGARSAGETTMSLSGGVPYKEAADYPGAKLWGCTTSAKSRNYPYTGGITDIQQAQAPTRGELPSKAWREKQGRIRPVSRLPYANPYSTAPSAATGYPHEGVDFSATGAPPWENPPYGMAVRSIAGGTVVFIITGCEEGGSGEDLMCGDGWGNHVVVDHGGNVFTRYSHLQKGTTVVDLGQTLNAGDTIGKIGSTGWSMGAHLHFELGIMSPGAQIPKCAPFKFAQVFDPAGPGGGANEWTDP
ncbi:MAG: M23 family metallopeptidase [Silvanigrellales bacterium]|nr:M23 family metallopeptidase [Silvanigrellales bacterium]